jgi:hypothetical protein
METVVSLQWKPDGNLFKYDSKLQVFYKECNFILDTPFTPQEYIFLDCLILLTRIFIIFFHFIFFQSLASLRISEKVNLCLTSL